MLQALMSIEAVDLGRDRLRFLAEQSGLRVRP